MTARTLCDAILAALAIAFVAFATGLTGASAQNASSVQLVGADAIVEGNTSTSLGTRDACVRTEVGSQVKVDIIVDEVPADRLMIGFQMTIVYNPDILTVTEMDHDFLLGAVGQYQPFPNLSDTLPDTDGLYSMIVADLAYNSDGQGGNAESGPGVLARITFTAKAAGRTDVGPSFEGTGGEYPTVIDKTNSTIEVNTIAHTIVTVGQDCPTDVQPEDQVTPLPPLFLGSPTPGPSPTRTLAPGETAQPTDGPTDTPSPSPSRTAATSTPDGEEEDDEGGGTNTAGIIVAGLLGGFGVALLGGSGYLLYRRRAAGTGPG